MPNADDLLRALVNDDTQLWYDYIACWWCDHSPWEQDDGKGSYAHEDDCPWLAARRYLGLSEVME